MNQLEKTNSTEEIIGAEKVNASIDSLRSKLNLNHSLQVGKSIDQTKSNNSNERRLELVTAEVAVTNTMNRDQESASESDERMGDKSV